MCLSTVQSGISLRHESSVGMKSEYTVRQLLLPLLLLLIRHSLPSDDSHRATHTHTHTYETKAILGIEVRAACPVIAQSACRDRHLISSYAHTYTRGSIIISSSNSSSTATPSTRMSLLLRLCHYVMGTCFAVCKGTNSIRACRQTVSLPRWRALFVPGK